MDEHTFLNHAHEVQEFNSKIIVIGDVAVGKTAIIKRYTKGTFSNNYKLTVGVDFALRTLQWNENTRITLQLWDIAGHERFGHMTRVYYKYAVGAIIVFDITRPETFNSISQWCNDVRNKVLLPNGSHVPILLFANKCDLEMNDLDTENMDKFCNSQNMISWFRTSAKEDINIEKGITFLLQYILKTNGHHLSAHRGFILADPPAIRGLEEKKTCCW